MANLRFPQLRTPMLASVHISDHSPCSLIDVNMFHPDVLVTTVT
jgi:hypothetical protein